MKSISIIATLAVIVALAQPCLAEDGGGKPVAEGRVFYDPDDIYGIAPTDRTMFPLLSRGRPGSGFGFVLFYSEADLRRLDASSIEQGEIVLDTPKEGRARVLLSEIAGFELHKYRRMSRSELSERMDELISKLIGLHREYTKEYEKYLSTMFRLPADTYYINAWNYLYNAGEQKLQLPLLQGLLSEGLRWVSYQGCSKWNRLWIQLKLPGDLAKEVAKGVPGGAVHLDPAESPRALYTYIVNPKPAVMKWEDDMGRVGYWMPSLELHSIEIGLRDKTDKYIVGYMLEDISPSRAKCGPSFGKTYTIHPKDKAPL